MKTNQVSTIQKPSSEIFRKNNFQTGNQFERMKKSPIRFVLHPKYRSVFLLIVFFIMHFGKTIAQSDLLHKPFFSFETFKEQVSHVKVPGFDMITQFDDNEDEGEYLAIYTRGDEVFFFKIEYRETKGIYEPALFLDGKAVEFHVQNELTFMMIDLPEINSILTLGSNKLREKSDFEALARKSGFLELESEVAVWPSIIPMEYRIEGVLLEAISDDSSDTGVFSAEARITLLMSDEVKNSIIKLMEEFDSAEEIFISFPDGTILNLPFSHIEDIDNFPPYSLISFVYFIP